jgi:DNA invertase Pin-like site-specific DNA recombinase
MNYGYIRNSRVSQENSVETQKKLIIDFCEINNIHLDDIIIDFGISGSGDKTHKRDGYNYLLKRVENNEVDNIIVLSLSRFGRNLGEIYKSVELMEKHHTKFYSIKENVDTSSIYGKFTINLLGSLYEMELNILKERVVDTLRVKKDNNKVYSPTPYGFDRVGDDLVENPKEMKLMKKLIRLRTKGSSYGKITDFLNRNRYKTKSGKKFSKGNVYQLINSRIEHSPQYVG